MSDMKFTLDIKGFTPANMPMARLAEYLKALADLLGSEPQTHFEGVTEGSVRLVASVEERESQRVRERVLSTGSGKLQSVEKAYVALDDLLANDNTVGCLIGPDDEVVMAFPGATRPKPIAFPAFRQNGSIDGEVVRLGGIDMTAHLTLQDGATTYSNITLRREVAKQLAPYLYGQKVRLHGSGRWERQPDGVWKLLSFSVDRFESLDEAPLNEVLNEIRAAIGDLEGGLYGEVLSLRGSKDSTH